jgi:TPR repeat protein
MATPEHDDKPASSPLDAEREKLRKAGYNETEISQILVARTLGSSGHSVDAPTSQGVLSGTVSSVLAIGSYARGTVFTIRHDLETIFDRTALASARVGAAVMLFFKVAVIAVLAYAGWQEWRQHIISATEIAESQARKIKAEECIARVESAAKNMRMSDIEKGIYSNEELARDCDPNYAHRKALEAACSAKLNAILDAMSTLSADEFKAKIDEHKKTCSITDADREAANAKIDAVEKDRKQTVAELSSQMQATIKAREQFDAGHYDEAFKAANDSVIAADALETKTLHKPGGLTAEALAKLSWYGLFARQYARALDGSERAIKLNPNNLVPVATQAHALMLLGRIDEAKAIYLAHRGETLKNKKWEQVISEDFAQLRQAGITQPMMAEIETTLSGQPTSTALSPTEPLSGPLAADSPLPDPDVEAVRRYKLAADRGDADAQLHLGMMYGSGRGGLARDPLEAARLFKLSADQGNALAQLQLAYIYENGDILPKDWREAARLYRLAADQGNADAQANLADFYERGDAGLRKNACEAMRLRKLAAAQGNAYAERNLKEAVATRCKP